MFPSACLKGSSRPCTGTPGFAGCSALARCTVLSWSRADRRLAQAAHWPPYVRVLREQAAPCCPPRTCCLRRARRRCPTCCSTAASASRSRSSAPSRCRLHLRLSGSRPPGRRAACLCAGLAEERPGGAHGRGDDLQMRAADQIAGLATTPRTCFGCPEVMQLSRPSWTLGARVECARAWSARERVRPFKRAAQAGGCARRAHAHGPMRVARPRSGARGQRAALSGGGLRAQMEFSALSARTGDDEFRATADGIIARLHALYPEQARPGRPR